MRVAIIQLAETLDTRSAHIARLLRLINRTCERDPAPDLLVLPAECGSSPSSDGHKGITRAMGDTLAGLLAMQAREWGIFIAGGMRSRDETGPLARGLLFDPDGDVLIRTCRDDDAARLLARVTKTPMGAVGLLLHEHLRGNVGDSRPEHCDVLVVLGSAQDGGAVDPGPTLSRLAHRVGCYVCYASPIVAGAGGLRSGEQMHRTSRIHSPDGSQLACASDQEDVLIAELGVSAKSGE